MRKPLQVVEALLGRLNSRQFRWVLVVVAMFGFIPMFTMVLLLMTRLGGWAVPLVLMMMGAASYGIFLLWRKLRNAGSTRPE